MPADLLTRWRVLAFTLANVELLVFSGLIYGWPSLVYVLKDEGFYNDLCLHEDILSSNGSSLRDCDTKDQSGGRDLKFSAVFSVSLACLGVGSCLLGQLQAHVGIRTTKLVCIALICTGCTITGFADPGTEWLLFPGLSLLSAGGKSLKVTNSPIANLFPTGRLVLLAIMMGAISSSGGVQLIVKIVYESGISRRMSYFFLAGLSITMVPATIWLMPSGLIETPTPTIDSQEDTNTDRTVVTDGDALSVTRQNNDILESSISDIDEIDAKPISYIEHLENTQQANSGNSNTLNTKKELPNSWTSISNNKLPKNSADMPSTHKGNHSPDAGIMHFVKTKTFIHFNVWFLLNVIFTSFFVVTLNPRLVATLSTDEEVSSYTDAAMYFQMFSGFILYFLTGIIYQLNYKLVPERFKDDHRHKLAACIPFCLGTAANLALASLTVPDDVTSVFYPSFVLYPFSRAFLFGVASNYVTVMFPARHVGVFFGVLEVLTSISSLLQYALVYWAEQMGIGTVASWLLALVALSAAHPLYILVTEMCMYSQERTAAILVD